MIVECPNCHTRFRLDEQRLTEPRAQLKCARCQHVFAAPAARPAPAPPDSAPTPKRAAPSRPPRAVPPVEETLSFSFGDEDEEWRAGDSLGASGVPEEQFSLGVGSKVQPPAPPRRQPPRPAAVEDDLFLRVDDDEAPTVVPEGETVAADDIDEDVADDVEDVANDVEDEEMAESGGGSISLRPVFVFLLLVVAAYAVLARTLYANPEWAQQITHDLPVLGNDVRDRTLNRSVALIGIQGQYERSKDGALVFLVSGLAHNQSAVSLDKVQIIARLFDAQSRQIDEQMVYCGNSVRRELLRDLSTPQIAVLKGLKPPQRLGVQPGEKCPFVTIFTDVPPAVASVTTEVATAQRHG